jgi:hypothetical protein
MGGHIMSSSTPADSISSTPTATPPLELLGHLSNQLAAAINSLANTLEEGTTHDCQEPFNEFAHQFEALQTELQEASRTPSDPSEYNGLHTRADALSKQAHDLHLSLIGIAPKDSTSTADSPVDYESALRDVAAITGLTNTIQRIMGQFRTGCNATQGHLPALRDDYAFSRIKRNGDRDQLRLTDPNGESLTITAEALGAVRDELYSVELAL